VSDAGAAGVLAVLLMVLAVLPGMLVVLPGVLAVLPGVCQLHCTLLCCALCCNHVVSNSCGGLHVCIMFASAALVCFKKCFENGHCIGSFVECALC
jgi:hypothetical protein